MSVISRKIRCEQYIPNTLFSRAQVESSLYTLGLHLALEHTGRAETTPGDGHSPFHSPEGKGAS